MARIEPRTVRTKDGAMVLLRSGEPGDAAGLIAYHREMALTSRFTVTGPDEVTVDEAKEAEDIRALADGANSIIVAAVHEGRIVGDLTFKTRPRKRMAHHGHFGIGLLEPWRGRGVGRAMLALLIEWARAHPTIEKVCLGVVDGNEHAIALYRKMGFVEECRREKEFKFGPGEYVDDIQMSMWVKEVEEKKSAAGA